jgi:hypothetical protein
MRDITLNSDSKLTHVLTTDKSMVRKYDYNINKLSLKSNRLFIKRLKHTTHAYA